MRRDSLVFGAHDTINETDRKCQAGWILQDVGKHLR
jgi:hypothetical protein